MIHRLLLHPLDQPLFSVALRSAGGAVELRINDVPVFRDRGDAALNVTLPINEWLFQGTNEIRLEIAETSDGSPEAEARLEYRRLRQPLKNSLPLGTLRATTDSGVGTLDEGDESHTAASEEAAAGPLATPGAEMEFFWSVNALRSSREHSRLSAATFVLPRPWPVCPWSDGADLREQVNLKYAVRPLVQNFWSCLARRDLDALLKVSAVRAASLEAAYHLGPEELEDALLFPRLLRSSDWAMAALGDEEWQLEIAGQGRLARLVEETSGESPLRLVNENEKIEAVIDAWWAFTHRWSLMR